MISSRRFFLSYNFHSTYGPIREGIASGADGDTVMMKPENLIAFDGARKLVGL
jgi:hypothetical protein